MFDINLFAAIVNLIVGILCWKQGLTNFALINFYFFVINCIILIVEMCK